MIFSGFSVILDELQGWIIVLAFSIGVLDFFFAAPRLAVILFPRLKFLHQNITSDIPGNPHCFHKCIISLFRTIPEPSNTNLVWTGLPLSEPMLIRGKTPPCRVSSISLYGKGSIDPPSTIDLTSDNMYFS
jgi:hypothetical protein